MTTDIDRIRTTHAAAIANRQRGSFDSRDDDIGLLLREVDRRTAEVKQLKNMPCVHEKVEQFSKGVL